MMQRKAFVELVGPLALRLRHEMDAVQWKLLHESLDDIPEHLLRMAVLRAAKTRKWFPKDCEFREDAEACRLELRAAQTFTACEQCNQTGWDTVLVEGISRVTRCVCWKAYQAKLAELGATNTPLALPAAESSEMSRVGE